MCIKWWHISYFPNSEFKRGYITVWFLSCDLLICPTFAFKTLKTTVGKTTRLSNNSGMLENSQMTVPNFWFLSTNLKNCTIKWCIFRWHTAPLFRAQSVVCLDISSETKGFLFPSLFSALTLHPLSALNPSISRTTSLLCCPSLFHSSFCFCYTLLSPWRRRDTYGGPGGWFR